MGPELLTFRHTLVAPLTIPRTYLVRVTGLRTSSGNFSAMPDFEHDYFSAVIVHEVGNSIVALADAVLILSRELLTARWSRIGGETFNSSDKATTIFLANRLQFLGGRRFDEERIGVHAASGL